MQRKISVVMPLFNKQSYVGEALQSVASQTFRDFEIIVIDDGSTDDGASVVTSMNLPGLRLITQENAGVSAARNRGLTEAKSDLVAFLDADDVWREEHLQYLWDLSVAYPDACLLADNFVEARDVSRARVIARPVTHRRVKNFLAESAGGKSWVFTSSAMVRRDACLSVGGFQIGESRGEDIELWVKMAQKFPVALSDYVGSIYRRASNGLTTLHPVIAPDVAMRWISSTLDCERDMPQKQRCDLKEFYNRLAITNALECILIGQRQPAREFVALASDTRLNRHRWRLVWLLSILPASLAATLLKFRNLTKRSGQHDRN